MKKLFSLLLAILTVFLCGCSKNEPSVTVLDLISKPFGCNMDILVLNAEFKAEFVKNNDESMSMTLSEPELLSGMTFGYESGEVSVSMFGLTVSIDSADRTSASVSETLFDLYSNEGSNDLAFSDTKILLINTSDRGTSTIEFDKETLTPLKMYNSRRGIEITYSDYHLL